MTALVGTIKSFGLHKGFGFISCEQVPADIYVNRAELPEAVLSQGAQLEGRTVTFELRVAPDGKPQAKNVQVVPIEGEENVGEVKSYNEKNGFGFISCPSFPGDVYFNRRDVPQHLPQSALVGLKVRFLVTLMPDGKVQARNLNFGVSPAHSNSANALAMQQQIAIAMALAGGKGKGAVRPMAALPAAGMMAPAPAALGMPAEGAHLVGVVKMFDAAKGFGFISTASVPADVYFKSTEPVDKDTQVSFTLHWSPKGQPQASDLQPALQAGEALVGTVKSYNPAKGFGFVTADRSQDVYFQTKDLPADLQTPGLSLEGTTVRFSVRLSKDGRPQMQDAELLAHPPQGVKRLGEGEGADDANGAAKRVRTALGGQTVQPAWVAALPRPSSISAASMASAAAAAAAAGATVAAAGERVYGRVKSYNAAKGFGFIESPSVPQDVYFQRVALPSVFQQQNLIGQEVSFDLKYTPDGRPQGVGVQVEG